MSNPFVDESPKRIAITAMKVAMKVPGTFIFHFHFSQVLSFFFVLCTAFGVGTIVLFYIFT